MAALIKPLEPPTVRFVGMMPREEIVRFAQRCVKERWLQGPLTIVIALQRGADGQVYEVRIETPDRVGESARDKDVLHAIGRALDRFELHDLQTASVTRSQLL